MNKENYAADQKKKLDKVIKLLTDQMEAAVAVFNRQIDERYESVYK